MVLKQDKGRGVVIMNRSTYIEKCFFIINSNQFTQLDHDPSDKFNKKLQTAQKMKFSITLQFQIIVPPLKCDSSLPLLTDTFFRPPPPFICPPRLLIFRLSIGHPPPSPPHIIWNLRVRIFSVNKTKSTVCCGFDHIYWRKSLMENFIFCAVTIRY